MPSGNKPLPEPILTQIYVAIITRPQWVNIGWYVWSCSIDYFIKRSCWKPCFTISWYIYHYNDIIMGTIVSQITCFMIVYSTVYSDADQRKYQSSVSLAFVRGIHRAQMASNAENVSIWWPHHASTHWSLGDVAVTSELWFLNWLYSTVARHSMSWWHHQMETFSA